jgi:BirA family biotin operon repressor/biotin-[acetyl-CoA-carboxylase] ligase
MFTILHYDAIGSTNDEARRLAAEGAVHGTAVHADEQKSGRGRLARPWFSPPGNLYMSVLLRLGLPPARVAELSFVAAVAVAETVAGLLPRRGGIVVKWPNDVLVDGGKIAGILVENAEDATVLGIGLNVLQAPATAAYQTATLVGCGGIASVDGARDLLLHELERLLTHWLDQGFAPIREAWLARGHPPGTRLRVTVRGQVIEGAFVGLDTDGALLLDTAEGARRIVVGDVTAA